MKGRPESATVYPALLASGRPGSENEDPGPELLRAEGGFGVDPEVMIVCDMWSEQNELKRSELSGEDEVKVKWGLGNVLYCTVPFIGAISGGVWKTYSLNTTFQIPQVEAEGQARGWHQRSRGADLV